jgi:hypothetical protein
MDYERTFRRNFSMFICIYISRQLRDRNSYVYLRPAKQTISVYCDMTPEIRNSGARADIHCYATTL